MKFKDFIDNLNKDDKANFLRYSKIRGNQIYRIIFECLSKDDESIKYNDVNSFVKYDKSIRDVLYVYLGTLEEYIKTYILSNFNIKQDMILLKKTYLYFKDLPEIEKVNMDTFEINDLYKRFSLTFGEIIKFLKEYDSDAFNLVKLEKIRKLRNKVMHHSPLFYDINFISIKDNTEEQIRCLIDLLPEHYQIGITKKLNEKTEATKRDINKTFYKYLLFRKEE